MKIFWVIWCWLLNICPACEQTYMYADRHWPVSKCQKSKTKGER